MKEHHSNDVMTLSITTLSIMGLFATLSITELHAIMLSVILSVALFYCYAECRYAHCRRSLVNGAMTLSITLR